MVNKLLCKEQDSLLRTLQIINENARGVVFVTNEDKKMIGLVTDGDIRRLLLDGVQLDEQIGAHVNRKFAFARNTDNVQDIARKLDDRVKIIPILDQSDQVIDFYEIGNKSYVPVAAPSLKGNEFKYLTDALLSTWISSKGKYINRLENEFSEYCGTQYGIAVSNGTVAIHLALVALNVGPGDEVIIPDLTFAATINAVLHCGATPVIVDIDEDTWCIDPAKIQKALTSKTKAIIPVHVYGTPCDMGAIMSIAQDKGLYVIEDCAEAHGAEFEGKKVGSFGDISTFSFFANKIITCGEGGICLTNNSELDKRLRKLRDHGMNTSKRYWHDEVGYNYRMTNLQASIGVAQLERIDEILERRNEIKGQYQTIYQNCKEVVFQNKPKYDSKTVVWLVCALIEGKDRDEMIEHYKSEGVELRPFFYPLSAMEIYAKYAPEPCPVTEKISQKGINFPTYNELEKKHFNAIEKVLK
ncbi:MAG: aminotransferase class I/II-fold pyridoxal phosphate-dependent enzyme [Flavobacteriales bacterium]|nr:aminotransferase class I/II-fold pyridoxal phosphate-dependent enzyme [Flavobacteriales bacterium]